MMEKRQSFEKSILESLEESKLESESRSSEEVKLHVTKLSTGLAFLEESSSLEDS